MKNAPPQASSKHHAPEAILIDLELCKACGICVEFCPKGVFDRDELDRPVVARLSDCTACTFCERHCPDFAVDVVRSKDKT